MSDTKVVTMIERIYPEVDSSALDENSVRMPRRKLLRRVLSTAGVAISGIALNSVLSQKAEAQTPRTTLTQQMRSVQRHENDHVAFLVQALGAAARPKPTFQNIDSPNLSAFLGLARALENVGVGAYLGAAPMIFSRSVLASAGSIATIEARHAGMFNSLQSIPVAQNAFGTELSFERAFTPEEVVSFAGPYVASLNGGPALTYSSVPSPDNDIQILNFALALEYLEAEYYNINVPRYYP